MTRLLSIDELSRFAETTEEMLVLGGPGTAFPPGEEKGAALDLVMGPRVQPTA